MKKLILIMLFVASLSFGQVIKKIYTQEISGHGIVTQAEILEIQEDIYLVNLGNMVLNEENVLTFEVVFGGSFILKKDATFNLTKKEVNEIMGIKEQLEWVPKQ